VVAFGFEQRGKRLARFAVQNALLTLDPPADQSLAPPKTTASGMAISGWANEDRPTLNGKPLTLKPYERSRSLAIARMASAFCLAQNGICGSLTEAA
jgi:hypothetical protein